MNTWSVPTVWVFIVTQAAAAVWWASGTDIHVKDNTAAIHKVIKNEKEIAIIQVQQQAIVEDIGEIKEDYFDKKGKPHIVPVQLPAGQNGEMKTINRPVITLVPHNGMAIKEVEIEMQVALSPGESEEINKSKAIKKKPSRIRSFLTDLSNRNKGHEMAKIKVKFNGQEAPEGLARIKDSLVKIIPN